MTAIGSEDNVFSLQRPPHAASTLQSSRLIGHNAPGHERGCASHNRLILCISLERHKSATFTLDTTNLGDESLEEVGTEVGTAL